MTITICLDAATLATMSHDDVARTLGFVPRATTADAATVAARRRGTPSAPVATDDTTPGIVLISAENNPLA